MNLKTIIMDSNLNVYIIYKLKKIQIKIQIMTKILF